jgi:hypothetical protein
LLLLVLVLARRLQEATAPLEGQAVVAGKRGQDQRHERQGHEGVASCHVAFWGMMMMLAWDGGEAGALD